jgi:hypothetical protein
MQQRSQSLSLSIRIHLHILELYSVALALGTEGAHAGLLIRACCNRAPRADWKSEYCVRKSTRSKFKAPRTWKENPYWTSSRFSSTRPGAGPLSSVSGVCRKTLPSSSARWRVQARRTCPCARAEAASCEVHAALEVSMGLPRVFAQERYRVRRAQRRDRSGTWVFSNATHLRQGIL